MCGYKALTFYTMKTETLKVQARDSFCDVKYQLYSKHATATSPVQRTRWWHNAYNNYVLYHTELSWGAALKRYFSPGHEIQTFLDVKGQDARVVSGSEWLANSYFLHSFTCHESSQLKVDKSQDDLSCPMSWLAISVCTAQCFHTQLWMCSVALFQPACKLHNTLTGQCGLYLKNPVYAGIFTQFTKTSAYLSLSCWCTISDIYLHIHTRR